MFEAELRFFVSNQAELCRKHPGKTLAIQGSKVLGAYDSPLKALTETRKAHALGTFMVQPCVPGPEAYTVTISSSRVEAP